MVRLRKQTSRPGAFTDAGAWALPAGPESVVAGTVLALVIFGSLTPFSFELAAAGRTGGVGRIGWPLPDAADVVTNIVVYLPIGASLVGLFRRRFAAPASVAGAVFCGTCLSFTMEALQTIIATRYASWIDVIINAAGTAGGAAAGLVVAPLLACRLGALRLRAAPR